MVYERYEPLQVWSFFPFNLYVMDINVSFFPTRRMGPVRIGACEVACPAMPRERTLDISMRDPELGANVLIRTQPRWVGLLNLQTRCEDSELTMAFGEGAGSKDRFRE